VWSSATSPPHLLTTGPVDGSDAEPHESSDGAPIGPPLTDLTVAGAGGNIHVLVARPDSPAPPTAPGPTVFLVHGGPAAHDADSYSPVRNAWTSLGFTTVQVNYRGSSGYGSEWRGANIGRSGQAELEDLVTVRDALVADGTADPDRVVIAGRSWGGYLALLALGRQPGLWSLGVAIVPVADTSAVYEDMMDQLRASYRVRFGGSPTDVPEAYAAASPLTFVADVAAPVLITAGLQDPRCPVRQIELYVSRLAELSKPHEYRAFDRGHEARARDERVEEMAMVFDFVGRHL
jgi:dipeptidyl aminopeptidase/acylaminoacyl peptidase